MAACEKCNVKGVRQNALLCTTEFEIQISRFGASYWPYLFLRSPMYVLEEISVCWKESQRSKMDATPVSNVSNDSLACRAAKFSPGRRSVRV